MKGDEMNVGQGELPGLNLYYILKEEILQLASN